MVYYICARKNQCAKPCNNSCFLTTNFFKSRIFHDEVKPETIVLNQNKKGNWCEIDPDYETLIPEEFWSKNAIAIGKFSYDALCQMETARHFKRRAK